MLQLSPENKKKLGEMVKKMGGIRKEEGRSILIARGMTGQLELWLPHDTTDEYSRVFAFQFHTGLRFKQTSHIENYFDERTGQFLNSIVARSNKMADVCIYELGLKMYNRHVSDKE